MTSCVPFEVSSKGTVLSISYNDSAFPEPLFSPVTCEVIKYVVRNNSLTHMFMKE